MIEFTYHIRERGFKEDLRHFLCLKFGSIFAPDKRS